MSQPNFAHNPGLVIASVPDALKSKIDIYQLEVQRRSPQFTQDWNNYLRGRVALHIQDNRRDGLESSLATKFNEIANSLLVTLWNKLGSSYFISNVPASDLKSAENFFNKVLLERCLKDDSDDFKRSVQEFRSKNSINASPTTIDQGIKFFLDFIKAWRVTQKTTSLASAVLPHAQAPNSRLMHIVKAQPATTQTSAPQSYIIEQLRDRDWHIGVTLPIYFEWLQHLRTQCDSRPSDLHSLSRLGGYVKDYLLFAVNNARSVAGTNQGLLAQEVTKRITQMPSETLEAHLKAQQAAGEHSVNLGVRRKALLDEFYAFLKQRGVVTPDWDPRVDSLMPRTDAPVGKWYRDFWTWMTDKVKAKESSQAGEGARKAPDFFSEDRVIEIGRAIKGLIEKVANSNKQLLEDTTSVDERGDALLDLILSEARRNLISFLNESSQDEEDRSALWGKINETFYTWAAESGRTKYDPKVEIFIQPTLELEHPIIRWWAEQTATAVYGTNSGTQQMKTSAGVIRSKTLARYINFIFNSEEANQLANSGDKPKSKTEILDTLLNQNGSVFIKRFVATMEQEGATQSARNAADSSLRRDIYPGAYAAKIIHYDIVRDEIAESYPCKIDCDVYKRWQDELYLLYTSEEQLATRILAVRSKAVATLIEYLWPNIPVSQGQEGDNSREEILVQSLLQNGSNIVEAWVADMVTQGNTSLHLNEKPALLSYFLPWLRQNYQVNAKYSPTDLTSKPRASGIAREKVQRFDSTPRKQLQVKPEDVFTGLVTAFNQAQTAALGIVRGKCGTQQLTRAVHSDLIIDDHAGVLVIESGSDLSVAIVFNKAELSILKDFRSARDRLLSQFDTNGIKIPLFFKITGSSERPAISPHD